MKKIRNILEAIRRLLGPALGPSIASTIWMAAFLMSSDQLRKVILVLTGAYLVIFALWYYRADWWPPLRSLFREGEVVDPNVRDATGGGEHVEEADKKPSNRRG